MLAVIWCRMGHHVVSSDEGIMTSGATPFIIIDHQIKEPARKNGIWCTQQRNHIKHYRRRLKSIPTTATRIRLLFTSLRTTLDWCYKISPERETFSLLPLNLLWMTHLGYFSLIRQTILCWVGFRTALPNTNKLSMSTSAWVRLFT